MNRTSDRAARRPRKVRRKTVGIMLLARVPTKFDVWPKDADDYTFDLQTAGQIVAPPTFTGELVKLDKGPAIVSLQARAAPSHHARACGRCVRLTRRCLGAQNKHNLRPFMLDVYKVGYQNRDG